MKVLEWISQSLGLNLIKMLTVYWFGETLLNYSKTILKGAMDQHFSTEL